MRTTGLRIVSSLLALAFAFTSGRALAAPDYSSLGPEATTAFDLAAGTAGATGGTLVVPDGAGPYPLIVAVHGWSASSKNQLGWANHFASYGFVVVVPDMPSPLSPDTATNKAIIVDLVAKFADATFDSPAKGKVDSARIGLEGHSAGGLAVTVASAQLAPRATVLFDPVDKAGAGKTAYGTLCTPVLGLFAGPGSCNQNAEWSTFRQNAKGELVVADVVGATHCDGENAPRSLCGPFCGGGASDVRQAVHARYATAFLLARLKDDATAAAELTAAKLSADDEVSGSFVRDTPSASCSQTSSDAGASDASSAKDAAANDGAGGTSSSNSDAGASVAANDAGASGNANGASGDAAGDGCHTASGPSAASPLAIAFALLVLGRRRHRRS